MEADQTQAPTDAKPASVPLSQLPRLLVGRRWWWTTLLVIAAAGVMVRLGIWQLDRLQQRKAQNALLAEQLAAAPLQLTGNSLEFEPGELKDRPAQARGLFDFSQQLVLTQQSWFGAPGVHLITPLLIEGSEKALLVDRGWIPSADAEAGDLDQFNEPNPQTVSGAIQPSQTLSGGRQTLRDSPQQEWYRVDIEAIQDQMPYELLPVFLLQAPPDNPQEQLPYRTEPDIDLSDGPHLGYAIQWFLFATVLVLGYARYVAVHSRRR